MRQSLQSKFNALSILFVVLFLLMLPMFTQVKADARDSAKDAKSTLLSKLFRDIAKDLKKEALGDEEVEDYWAKYGNEAKEKDPNCGAECDPDADKDGDGVSNKDEVKNGTNPSCNEKEKGEDFCKGIDPYAPVDPKNETKVVTYEFLKTLIWRGGSSGAANCTNQGSGPASFTSSCAYLDIDTSKNYTRLVIFLNATNVQAVSWSFTQTNNVDSTLDWQGSNPGGSFEAQPRSSGPYEGWMLPAEPGKYRFQPRPNSANSGAWTLNVYGLVEA